MVTNAAGVSGRHLLSLAISDHGPPKKRPTMLIYAFVRAHASGAQSILMKFLPPSMGSLLWAEKDNLMGKGGGGVKGGDVWLGGDPPEAAHGICFAPSSVTSLIVFSASAHHLGHLRFPFSTTSGSNRQDKGSRHLACLQVPVSPPSGAGVKRMHPYMSNNRHPQSGHELPGERTQETSQVR
jgi:hypothetical protein